VLKIAVVGGFDPESDEEAGHINQFCQALGRESFAKT
jgi:hypothetical protein